MKVDRKTSPVLIAICVIFTLVVCLFFTILTGYDMCKYKESQLEMLKVSSNDLALKYADELLQNNSKSESLDNQATKSFKVSSQVSVRQDSNNISVYDIKPGDTLTSISHEFGFSVDQIANLNQIRDVNVIYAGSSLRIPTK